MKRNGTKSGKKKQIWAKFPKLYWYKYRAVPVHPQQKPNCTGTGPSCTGTAHQKPNCTGTGLSCTGRGVPKMPRMLYFRKIKPKFTHR